MPTSEIDDIFSAKGKAKVVPLPSVDEKKEKKKKKRKDKLYAAETTKEIQQSSEPTTLKKRPAPETVVDPSSKSSSSSKRPKLVSQHVKTTHDKRKLDEDCFMDSRGSGSRKFQLFSQFKYR